MRDKPLFSIVTVTYNAQETIERTLRSVEGQTSEDYEHIIVDGLSGDHTMEIVKEYARRNEGKQGRTVRTVSERDKGLYDAMNKAIRLATGKYIVFLNAGDKLHYRTILEEVAAKTGERDYCVVYGETDIVDGEGKFLRQRRLRAPETLRVSSFKSGMLVCHQSFYALTAIAKETPYDDLTYRYSADYDWTIRIMKEGKRRGLPTFNTGLILTDYLSEGLTTKNHRKSLMERLHIMAKHYGWPVAVAEHLWFALRAIVKP